ncbi:hypothetical protein D3C80_774530 [compost metagenome]
MGDTTRCSGSPADGTDRLQSVVSEVPQLHVTQGLAKVKPRIRPWNGLWECFGLGLHSINESPESSYDSWVKFVERMRVHG